MNELLHTKFTERSGWSVGRIVFLKPPLRIKSKSMWFVVWHGRTEDDDRQLMSWRVKEDEESSYDVVERRGSLVC